ncbi:MAG: hypothetical protein R2865_02770 [Deinococcales bacterium]
MLDWQEPFVKWLWGKTNISYNSLDHQIDQGKGNKVAIFGKVKI